MKNFTKFVSGLMVISMLFLSGCGNSAEEDIKTTKAATKEYDIFIYNSDTDIGKAFREMCDEYTKRTGVIIRTVTPTEEESTVENLESYMNSEYPPDIFTVNNMQEMNKWQLSENIWDFSNATEESFKEVVNKIPEGLRLSSNTSDSFGVPATVEGYGYLVDPKMIASLFGGDKHRSALHDLQLCSYDEFSLFIDALSAYITAGVNSEFTLNGKNYSFAESKGELSENLNGVFSFAGGNEKISGSYLMNPILASIFSSPAFAYIANDSSTDQLSSGLMRYVEVLDLITSNIAGEDRLLNRGDEFISSSKNSSAQAIKNFVNGKSLFLLASTKDYENISIFNSLVSNRCVFVPIKMPITEFDVALSGNSMGKNINKSLTVFAPLYYCINAKSSDKEKKAAQEFLVWLRTSDLAEKYVIPELDYVPYDIEDGSVVDNPLERSMIDYMNENKTIPGIFLGAPNSWCNETMGKYIVNNLFSKSFWTLDDYEQLANYGIEKWKELKENQ